MTEQKLFGTQFLLLGILMWIIIIKALTLAYTIYETYNDLLTFALTIIICIFGAILGTKSLIKGIVSLLK